MDTFEEAQKLQPDGDFNARPAQPTQPAAVADGNMMTEEPLPGLMAITDPSDPLAPQRSGNVLIVTVVAPNVRMLDGPEAKRAAYEARYAFGFENAGIEKLDGPMPVNEKGQVLTQPAMDGVYTRFAMTFRLTRGI